MGSIMGRKTANARLLNVASHVVPTPKPKRARLFMNTNCMTARPGQREHHSVQGTVCNQLRYNQQQNAEGATKGGVRGRGNVVGKRHKPQLSLQPAGQTSLHNSLGEGGDKTDSVEPRITQQPSTRARGWLPRKKKAPSGPVDLLATDDDDDTAAAAAAVSDVPESRVLLTRSGRKTTGTVPLETCLQVRACRRVCGNKEDRKVKCLTVSSCSPPRQGLLAIRGGWVQGLKYVYPEDKRIGAVEVTGRDLMTLEPAEFVNDTIMDYQSMKIQEEYSALLAQGVTTAKIHFFTAFFFKKLTESGRHTEDDVRAPAAPPAPMTSNT